jgi:Tfp pilus assembly protein PilZ
MVAAMQVPGTPVAQASRSLLVVGPFPDDTMTRIQEAATAVSVTAGFVGRCEEIASALVDAEPHAILVRMDSQGAAKACAHVRAQARFAQVPIFGVASEPNDLAFTEVFGWGGDDVVGVASSQPLARRLRLLLAHPAHAGPPVSLSRMPALAGQAVVAGAEATWRTVMGRALYNGGFAVRFAASAKDLATECVATGVRVVVIADDFLPEGVGAALKSARQNGSDVAWVVVAPPKRMAAVRAEIDPAGRASVLDGFAPPENVLFVVNELLSSRGVDQRGSARLLYGTSVAFRAAGREEDEIGFSYNVSATGVYVRTLAPLEPKQDVWLEMWAPRSERRVRLAGTVAWRRPFGPRGGATVPAGFGVQLKEGLAGDLERWRAGYEAFAQTVLGASVVAAANAE